MLYFFSKTSATRRCKTAFKKQALKFDENAACSPVKVGPLLHFPLRCWEAAEYFSNK